MKKYFLIKISLFLFAVSFLTGCSNEKIQIENLDTAKLLVENYYESGQFESECKEIYEDAVSQIEKMKLPNMPAVIFDIDETVLLNYYNTKEIGFGYTREHWHQGILKADLPAVHQSKIFYDWLLSKNIRIIFLTGRYTEVREATVKNLDLRGFAKYDTLIVRSHEESKIPAAEYKARKRDMLTSKGYSIIASVGDQWSDLVGGNAGIKIKLPNYLYLID